MHWAARHVGIPYSDLGRGPDSFDCYGLIQMVLDREFGIRMDDLHNEKVGHIDPRDLRRRISQTVRVTEPRDGDILMFKMPRGWHVGLYVSRSRMLHTCSPDPSRVSRIDEAPWESRLVGVYRFE